jgi:hypothetical protein
MGDRAIQILALLVAVAGFTAAAFVQPKLVEMASEPYLDISASLPDSGERIERRVPLAAVRSIDTRRALTAGREVSVSFPGRIDGWQGRIGDEISVRFESSKGLDTVQGVLTGQAGFGLRYTDEAAEGAPPMVVLGTAIGALRGLLVDYLWIKLGLQKEQGLLYEVMADADLITALQPRFPDVWAFHGHNMAYNISVMTNTPEERWAWVNAGIALVRDKGVRYNPNSLLLCKELAHYFSHKVDGSTDDAHLIYKRQLAAEWQFLLGVPPPGYEERKLWIRAIADAPDSIEALYEKVPGSREFIESLDKRLEPLSRKFAFAPDKRFLMALGQWIALRESPYAQLLGLRAMSDDTAALFAVFDETFGKAENLPVALRIVAFLRKRVLIDSYNMDPALMAKYTEETGPLDWRHPAAHALYWAHRGREFGEHRVTDDNDIYKVLNNDRTEIQAMQSLARSGLVRYDPFSKDNVTRLNDPRWIKVIDRYFEMLYTKHYDVRGAGGDTFTNFHENFMKQAVRELYRSGDLGGAQEILDKLDRLYGRGSFNENSIYHVPLDEFVKQVTYGEYDMQPEVARSDVYAALERGFREGLLLDNEEVMKNALDFARDLTRYFRESRYNDFVNRFGEGRMKDLLGELDQSIPAVLTRILLDPTQPLLDRLIIFRKAPDDIRALVYDEVKPVLEKEFDQSQLASSANLDFARLAPEPAGLAEVRRARAEAAKRRSEEEAGRSEAERK